MAGTKKSVRQSEGRAKTPKKSASTKKPAKRKSAPQKLKYRGVDLEYATSPRKPKLSVDGEAVNVSYSKGDKTYTSPLQPYASTKTLEDLGKEVLDNAERYRDRGK